MNRTQSLLIVLLAASPLLVAAKAPLTAKVAQNKVAHPAATSGILAAAAYAITTAASNPLLTDPKLLEELDDTLIRGAKCRSMAGLGFANGYQCPAGDAYGKCMSYLTAGKVNACARNTGRGYGPAPGCLATETELDRANGKCVDLSSDLWASLAIAASLGDATVQLKAFGCTVQGKSAACASHVHEWLCMPFDRGGVLKCSVPALADCPKAIQ